MKILRIGLKYSGILKQIREIPLKAQEEIRWYLQDFTHVYLGEVSE